MTSEIVFLTFHKRKLIPTLHQETKRDGAKEVKEEAKKEEGGVALSADHLQGIFIILALLLPAAGLVWGAELWWGKRG